MTDAMRSERDSQTIGKITNKITHQTQTIMRENTTPHRTAQRETTTNTKLNRTKTKEMSPNKAKMIILQKRMEREQKEQTPVREERGKRTPEPP